MSNSQHRLRICRARRKPSVNLRMGLRQSAAFRRALRAHAGTRHRLQLRQEAAEVAGEQGKAHLMRRRRILEMVPDFQWLNRPAGGEISLRILSMPITGTRRFNRWKSLLKLSRSFAPSPIL